MEKDERKEDIKMLGFWRSYKKYGLALTVDGLYPNFNLYFAIVTLMLSIGVPLLRVFLEKMI